MMDKTSYLLVCAIEECAEVQQNISKTIRFGLEDFYKDGPTNQECIILEWIDLMTVMEELLTIGALKMPSNVGDLIQRKKNKLEQYMGYSRERGTLEQEESK